jgi:hypothetical protein
MIAGTASSSCYKSLIHWGKDPAAGDRRWAEDAG